jgi:hypothetical protein
MAAYRLGEQSSALWLCLALIYAALPSTVALAAGQQNCEQQDCKKAHRRISQKRIRVKCKANGLRQSYDSALQRGKTDVISLASCH